MATVEIPTHVCHILGTKMLGPGAIIGSDCPGTPLWDFLPCVAVHAATVACQPQALTLTAALPVSLPLVPEREEAP